MAVGLNSTCRELAERGGARQEAVLEACLERFYSRDGGAQEGMIIYRRSKEQVLSCF